MADDPEKKAETAPDEAPALEPETSTAADSSQGSAESSSDDAARSAEPDTESASDSPQAASSDDASASADDVAEEPEDQEPVAEAVEEPAEEKPAKAARPKRADRAASTPRRQRERKERGTDPTRPAPVVRAQAKYVRSSARKARLVCDHIRGKSVVEARAILAVTPRAIARDWSKLLESAVANAEHNHELVGEDLVVKAVHADEGPTIKRFRPRAMGRATPIRKRTSHLTILLTPKD